MFTTASREINWPRCDYCPPVHAAGNNKAVLRCSCGRSFFRGCAFILCATRRLSVWTYPVGAAQLLCTRRRWRWTAHVGRLFCPPTPIYSEYLVWASRPRTRLFQMSSVYFRSTTKRKHGATTSSRLSTSRNDFPVRAKDV